MEVLRSTARQKEEFGVPKILATNPTAASGTFEIRKGAPLASKETPAAAAAFKEFLDLAGQPRGGTLYGVKLWELANALDAGEFAAYARTVVAMPDDNGMGWATNILFSAWAHHDLSAACQFVLAMPPGQHLQQSSAVAGLVDAWPEKDSEGMIQMARKLSAGKHNNYDLRYLLSKAAIADPKAAIAAANELGLPMDETWVIVSRWMKQDESGAREWVLQQPAGRAREKIISLQVMSLSMGETPEKAIPWIELMDSQRERESALLSMVASWAVRDHAAAEEFVKAQEDPSIRNAARHGYILGVADSDPESAARMIEESGQDSQAGPLALAVLRRWLDRDVNAAAAYAASFPAGNLRNSAIEATMVSWGEMDPNASMAWLERQMPAGPERAALVNRLANNLGDDSPAAALKFAAAIPDQSDRIETQKYIASRWFDSSPVAATAWIRGSNLPDEIKAALLAPPPRR